MSAGGYSAASQRLLDFAILNKEDSDFRKEGEIVYVFDTSVLESYWRRDPTGTAGRLGMDELLDPKVATYSGWLALKFLMEHRLPGQKQSAYVSPSHWNEAIDRTLKLERDARGSLQRAAWRDAAKNGSKSTEPAIPPDPTKLDAALRQVMAVGPAERLQAAHQIGVGETFVAFMSTVSQEERIRRTFQDGRASQDGREKEAGVRDLSRCEFYSNLGSASVNYGDFRRWQGPIARERKRLQQARGKLLESPKNVDNDARTLAAIQAMYRGNLAALGTNPKVKFVFVTADIAIHEAYRELEARLSEEGIPYFLRHPHVYAPLLNFANMSRSVRPDDLETLRTVFDRVEEALGPLYDGYNLRSRLVQQYDTRLRYNVDAWSRHVMTICLANSDYVLSDISGDYISARSLAQLLSSPDMREAAARSVSAGMGHIRDDHLRVAALEWLEAAHDGAENGMVDHRAPVKLIGVDPARELGFASASGHHSTTWLNALLRNFRAAGGGTAGVTARLRELWDDPKSAFAAKLLASCIFFAVDKWQHAQLCAQLALKDRRRGGPTAQWIREARYCEALAMRMQLITADDFVRARGLLDRNLADSTDHLAELRDRVERSTLVLSVIIVQMAEERLPIDGQDTELMRIVPEADLQSEFDDAVCELERAVSKLEGKNDWSDPDIAKRVQLQGLINLLGARVFSHMFGDDALYEETSTQSLSDARARLEDLLVDQSLPHSTTAQFYIITARALETGDAAAAGEARTALDGIMRKQPSLSAMDRVEVDFVTSWLDKAARG